MKWVLATLLGRFHFALLDQAPLRVVQRDVLLPGGPIRLIVHPATGS